MSDSQTRRPSRAPNRFVSARKWQETIKSQKPVRETPIKRFDRKDVMERDLERYRAEARARLLRNGFDIPPFLMPKPKIIDDDSETPDPETVEVTETRPPAMLGPKPSPMVSDKQIAAASAASAERAQNATRPKPSRHVHVQNAASGAAALHGNPAAQASHEAAQAAAFAEEKTAYDEYVESLNGGATLLDRVRQSDDGDASSGNDIQGRVDDFKEKEVRQSRIDLPDNTANWAARGEMDRKRLEILEKQEKAKAKAARSKRKARDPITWDKFLPRAAAYMIAAVAIGYVLVLTVSEFSAILGK